MSEDIERTLCQLPSVHVFKIPARTSAEGYRAADWPKDPNWTGKLKVVARGSKLAIVLHDAANTVFAICQVTDDSCVERTLDSGRYFVLKISNAQGRHAFIGIAFNERSDAFDFNVALSNFKSEQEREQKASADVFAVSSEPSQDFSIKTGEKIKIKLNTKKSSGADDGAHHTPAHAADPFSDPFGSSDPFASSSSAGSKAGYSDPFSS
eukprot:gene42182-51510_t